MSFAAALYAAWFRIDASSPAAAASWTSPVVGAQAVGQLRAARPVADVIGERPARDRVGGDRTQDLEDRVRVERLRGERRLQDRHGGGELGVDVGRLDERRLRQRRDPGALDGRERRDWPGRGERRRCGERYRAGGFGGGECRGDPCVDLGVARKVVREGRRPGGDAGDRQPDHQPQGDESGGLRELTPATRWSCSPGTSWRPSRRPLAAGEEKMVCSISPIESDSEIHGWPRFLHCHLRCPARLTTGDVDGPWHVPRKGGGARHAAGRNRTASLCISGPVGRRSMVRWRQYVRRRPIASLRLSLDKLTETGYRSAPDGRPDATARRPGRGGLPPDGPRRAVAGLIADRDGPFTAADILCRRRHRRLGIGRATVFRAIDAFSELGVVGADRPPSGEHAYVGCEPDHRHHVVCERCGKTTRSMTGRPRHRPRRRRRTGFRIDSHRLELLGAARPARRPDRR